MTVFPRMFMLVAMQIAIGCFVLLHITTAAPVVNPAFITAQDTFKHHCIVCHGSDGTGKTDMGEGLGAPDFTDVCFQDSISDDDIIEQIRNGTEGKMFSFKDKLTVDEMKGLVLVIREFRGR